MVEIIICTFCLKKNIELEAMVYLNENVIICSECIDICNNIILNYRKSKSQFKLVDK